MNTVLNWLMSPEWGQIVEALLHSLWQAGSLALLLGLALKRLSSPAWRYRCAIGSLNAVLLATILTWGFLDQRGANRQSPPGIPAEALIASFEPRHRAEAAEKLIFATAPIAQRGMTTGPMNWTMWLALVWLLGAVLMLTRAGIQVAGAERLRRSGRPLEDGRIARLLIETQCATGLARMIRVTVTNTLTSPAVVGVLVPTLILPLSLVTALTHEQLRFVLLHELAHIRRGDYFVNLFQLFVEALLFFNPAVWWISQQVRREREACCDALAIQLSGAPVDYARTLVQVAESALNPSPAATAAFGNKRREPSSLSDRVQRLLVPGYRPALRLTWHAMLMSLVVGGTLLVLSALGTRNTVGAILANERNGDSNAVAARASDFPHNVPARPLAQSDSVRSNATALVQSTRLLLEAGKLDEAEERLKAALGTEPENQAAFHYLSYIKESRNRNAKGSEVVRVSREGSDGVQTTAGKLYSRRFKVDPQAFEQGLGIQWINGEWRFPSKTNAHEGFIGAVETAFAKVGVDLKSPKSFFYKNHTGEFLIRATQEDLDRLTPMLAKFSSRSPDPDGSKETGRPPATSPQEDQGGNNKSPFTVDAKKMNFAAKTQILTASNGVIIKHGEIVITADSARINHETGEAIAEGNARLQNKLGTMEGDRITVDSRSGRVKAERFTHGKTGNSTDRFDSQEPAVRDNSLALDAGTDKYAFQAAPSPTVAADEASISPKVSELRDLTNKVPVLSDLPIVGKLFRSSSNEPANILASNDQLYVRRFKVDPNTFTKNLEGTIAHQAKPTNVVAAVRGFFGSFGVELDPPKNVYFNDRAGELLVRATLQDLDVIEEGLQAINAPTPQVNIKVRFVEVDSRNDFGFDWFIGNLLLTATNSATGNFPAQFSGILTEPQYRVVLRTLEQRKGAKVLAMQEVTTFSGRQAQIQTVELRTVVNAMNLPLPALPGHTNTNTSTNSGYQTQVLPFGSVLDVIPFVAADGHTIQMTLLPTVTEFLGYDDPAKVLPGQRNLKRDGELPLPRIRVRQISMSANVWDGQTLFFGIASEEILSKKADGSVERNASRDAKKQLLVFVTPTIIDQGGNRMSAGDKLPTERSNPPEAPKN